MVKKPNGHVGHTKEILAPPPETVEGTPVSRRVIIQPGTALAWLENPDFNIMNRPIRQSDVTNWADIMKRKQWKCNGQPVIISDEGKLLDGQHRLWACVEAQTPFETYLLEGISKEVFDTIDVGKKRSASDMLDIHTKLNDEEPIKYKAAVMAAIMTILEYKNGVWKTRHSHVITHHDKLEFFKKNPSIKDWVMKARVKGTKRWENTYAANIGAIAFLGSKMYEKKAETFVIGFTTGNDLPVGSPISALRNRLGAEKHFEKWDRMKLIAFAWNSHVENENKQSLKMPPEMPIIAGSEAPIKLKKAEETKKKRITVSPKGKQTTRYLGK